MKCVLFRCTINYYYDREAQKIYFHGARAGHKAEAIRACDKVCFTVYGSETIREEAWAPYLRSVVVFGRCRLLEQSPETMALLKRFAMKYYPEERLADEEIRQDGTAAQIFEIEIHHLTTLCTRPADRPRRTFFHRNGLNL